MGLTLSLYHWNAPMFMTFNNRVKYLKKEQTLNLTNTPPNKDRPTTSPYPPQPPRSRCVGSRKMWTVVAEEAPSLSLPLYPLSPPLPPPTPFSPKPLFPPPESVSCKFYRIEKNWFIAYFFCEVTTVEVFRGLFQKR